MKAGEIIAEIRATSAQFKETIDSVKSEINKAGKYIKETEKKFKDMGIAAGDSLDTAKKEVNNFSEKIKANEQHFKALGVTAGAVLAGITLAVKKATDESKEYYKAMLSLRSTAESKGFMGADKAIQEMDVVRKGFISVQDAAVAASNLIKKEFTLDEAIEKVNEITAIAYTNKQAHLSLGEAVKSTTEGFKNEISTLSDAGGITKNISNIYGDYAKTINKTVDSLSEREKALALMVEIEEEAAIYANNLKEAEDSLAATEAELHVETKNLIRTYGESMEPALKDMYETLIPIVQLMTKWMEENPKLAANLTKVVVVVSTLTVGFSTAVIVIPKIIQGVKDLGIASLATSAKINAAKVSTSGWFTVLASNPMFIAIAGVAAFTAYTIAYNKAQEAAIQKTIQKGKAAAEEQREIMDLLSQYDALKTKTNLTTIEKEELKRVTERLIELVPDLTDKINEETEAYDTQAKKIKELALAKNAAELESGALAAELQLPNVLDDIEKYKQEIERVRNAKVGDVMSDIGKGFLEKWILGEDQFIDNEDEKKAEISRLLGLQAELENTRDEYEITINAWKEYQKAMKPDSAPEYDKYYNELFDSSDYKTPSFVTTKEDLQEELKMVDLQHQARELSDREYYNRLKKLQDDYWFALSQNEDEKLKLKAKINDVLDSLNDEQLKAQEEANEKQEKAFEDAYNESIDWIEKEKYYNRLSPEDETAAWQRVKSKAISGVYGPENQLIIERANREIYRIRKETIDKSMEAEKEYYNEKISQVDNWYSEEIDRLNQLQQAELDNIQERRDAYTELYQDRLDQLEEETNAAIRAKQTELTEIDRLSDTIDYERQVTDLENELKDKQSQYNLYKNAATTQGKETAKRLQEEIEDIKNKIQEAGEKRSLDLRKQSIQDEIQDIRDSADAKKKEWQIEYELKLKQYETEQDDVKDYYLNLESMAEEHSKKAKENLQNEMDAQTEIISSNMRTLSDKYGQINDEFMDAIENQGKQFELNLDKIIQNIKEKVQQALDAAKELSTSSGVVVNTSGLPFTNSSVSNQVTNNKSINISITDNGQKILNNADDVKGYGKELLNAAEDTARTLGGE